MSIVRQALKSVLASVLPPSCLLAHGPQRSAKTGPIELALTLDDGPHPDLTPAALDALGETGLKATFFVVGELAATYPDLIRRIAAEGHELGNHTWSHTDAHRTTTAVFLAEIRRTRQFLQDTTGHDCRLTRPPRGNLSVGTAIGLWREQQTIVLWNVDPKDFKIRDDAELHRWIDGYRPAAGDIVLLHDIHPHAPTVIRRLSEQSDCTPRFVTVSEWLNRTTRPAATPVERGRHA